MLKQVGVAPSPVLFHTTHLRTNSFSAGSPVSFIFHFIDLLGADELTAPLQVVTLMYEQSRYLFHVVMSRATFCRLEEATKTMISPTWHLCGWR